MNAAPQSEQLGFTDLLAATDEQNARRAVEAEAAHLPATMIEGVPFYRNLIKQHHAAILAADGDRLAAVKAKAALLALKLNGFQAGYLAGPEAAGCILERKTRARKGTVPLWGQSGAFEITVGATRVMIDLEGMLGVGASAMIWPGFAAHAVDWDQPFISETGYRSFLGVGGDLAPDILPDEFARRIIAAFLKTQLKGKLVAIKREYRERGEHASR